MHLKLLFIPILLCICISLQAQVSQKTSQLHTVPKDISKLQINAPSNRVEILKTKGTRIYIEATVRLGAGTAPLLNYLAQSGRYELEATIDAQLRELVLSPKKNQKILLIKGKECPEIVTYKIHIPESIQFVKTLESSHQYFIAHH